MVVSSRISRAFEAYHRGEITWQQYQQVRDSPPPISDPTPPATPPSSQPAATLLTCAVVIPCHNYGRFLAEAIESILAQTHPATEIVVVLDDCRDDSHEVARRYPVEVIVTQCCDATLSRRLGFRRTRSDVLVFLDADDRLSPNYLADGLPHFQGEKIGLVTGDAHNFGNSRHVWRPQVGTAKQIEQANFLTSAALVRRAAIEQSGCLDDLTLYQVPGEDWETWKRIMRAGWQAAKAPIIHHHRRHEANETLGEKWSHLDWAKKLRAASGDASKQKVRIGYLTPSMAVGGVTHVTRLQIKHADSLQWVGTHYTGDGQPHAAAAQVLPPQMPLEELIDTCDVLYGWMLPPETIQAIDNRKPLLYGVHAPGKWSQKNLQAVGPHVDRLWCVSREVRLALPADLQGKAELIPLGIDPAELVPARERSEIRHAWGCNDSHLIVGFVGRLSWEKNPLAVARAVALLPHKFRLLVCSPQASEPDNKFRREIAGLLGPRVIWTDSTQQPMADVYRGLDCLAISSHLEAGPLVMLEAMVSQCPVVTTPSGLPRDLLAQHGPVLQTIPLEPSADMVADAIEAAVDPSRKAWLDQGRDAVLYDYSAVRMVRDFERLAAELAEKKPISEPAPRSPQSDRPLAPQTGPSYRRSIEEMRTWIGQHACIRYLQDKRLAKVAAREMGVRVPKDVPLPNSYVIKPHDLHSNQGVNLIVDGQSISGGHNLSIVEELVVGENGQMPPYTYHCFTFGGRLKMVQVYDAMGTKAFGYYRWPNWDPLHLEEKHAWLEVQRPKRKRAAELEQTAEKLARLFPCPVRVDCYLTDTGVIFGEFCLTPGLNFRINDAGDRLLGQWWGEAEAKKATPEVVATP